MLVPKNGWLIEWSTRSNSELFERIEARDVEGARRSMRENIEQMRRNSERYAELSRQKDTE
jgi:DNA-binding GntR family transcriptional regulator